MNSKIINNDSLTMNVGSSTMNDDKKTYFQQIRYFGTMGSLIFFQRLSATSAGNKF